jgi:hypothetical protein
MGSSDPIPPAWVDTIDHREPKVKMKEERKGPDSMSVLAYATDGSETCNVIGGNMVCSRARWEGPYLRIDSTWNQDGVATTLQDRWSLSPDRRSLSIQRHVETPGTRTDQLIFLEKQ